MGKELEYKLHVSDPDALLKILEDRELNQLSAGPLLKTAMKTTYYDTPQRHFATKRWTFRRRQEGGKSVVCLKTPHKESHARREWEIEAECIDDSAVCRLIEIGAPKELLYLYSTQALIPICGAEFLRRHRMLEFPDGSRAELAADCGFLHGKEEQLFFCELELELYGGEAAEMLGLLNRLCRRYSLREEPLSKFARARALK